MRLLLQKIKRQRAEKVDELFRRGKEYGAFTVSNMGFTLLVLLMLSLRSSRLGYTGLTALYLGTFGFFVVEYVYYSFIVMKGKVVKYALIPIMVISAIPLFMSYLGLFIYSLFHPLGIVHALLTFFLPLFLFARRKSYQIHKRTGSSTKVSKAARFAVRFEKRNNYTGKLTYSSYGSFIRDDKVWYSKLSDDTQNSLVEAYRLLHTMEILDINITDKRLKTLLDNTAELANLSGDYRYKEEALVFLERNSKLLLHELKEYLIAKGWLNPPEVEIVEPSKNEIDKNYAETIFKKAETLNELLK